LTVLGAILTGPDHAVLWVCDELFRPGEPAPSAFGCKLAVNALAGCAGAGRGSRQIIGQADAALLAAIDLDGALKPVSTALRRASLAAGADFDRRPDDFARLSYAAVGYSPSAGRMLAYRFDAESFFAAVLHPQTIAPEIGLAEHWRPAGLLDVLAAAREQMAALRSYGLTGAGAGHLTVAEVRPGFIATQSFADFDAASTRRDRANQEQIECS
jgi:hypothetical protein